MLHNGLDYMIVGSVSYGSSATAVISVSIVQSQFMMYTAPMSIDNSTGTESACVT